MKKKRLTKKAALRICVDLWDWLSKNVGKEKEDWPGWGDIEKIYGRNDSIDEVFIWNCPCCQWTLLIGNDNEVNCAKCPLKNLWVGWCNSGNSPYNNWYRFFSDKEKNFKYAIQIRDGALEALSKLK